MSLKFHWEKFTKQIAFQRGEPKGTKSNCLHESFGQFLVRKKRVSAKEIEEEVKKIKGEDVHHYIGEWLAKKGIIELTEVSNLLEGHFRERLFNLLHLTRWFSKIYSLRRGGTSKD